ncbi:S41 family peptidase [Pseudonocardia sp.]|uniref:S41 family peptidase n=1 Tax=Pseudonocardia sp. TaxID=60912 RepID=UPI002626D61F|nr:S41 family peptidase [Pseudonocardia sp.]
MPLRSYLRFPHLRGDTLVFAAEDDIWIAPVTGGRAHRLTADAAPVARPRLCADGTRVAWASRRDGPAEIHVADVEGGRSRRLTWWGDDRTRPAGWDGDDVVAISADGPYAARRTWAHAVPANGGVPRLLPVGPVSDIARDGTRTLLCSTISREPAWWKRYRGGTAGKLWWDAGGTGEFVRIGAEQAGNIESPMLVGGRIAFLSDHEGWGNLYSLDTDGADLRRHTDHGGPDAPAFYARHATTDGTRVVYESAGRLFLVDDLDGAAPRPIDVALGGPHTARAPFRVSGKVSTAVPDRTGRTSIALLRGTVHRLTHRDGPARTLLAEPGVRARLARPLGEDRAVWVDDVLGEDAVCVAALDAHIGAEPRRSGAGELGRVLELEPAPDGAAVALTTHDGRLLLLDAASGERRELLRSPTGAEFSGLDWSPDGAWLACVEPAGSGLSRILLVRAADGEVVPVTPGRFHDRSPAFTADGRYLAFLSMRSFDPVYDQHSFDLAFPASWRPFLVPLAARTPSPFGASPDGRPVSAGEEGPADPPAPQPGDPSSPDAAAVPEEASEPDVAPVVVDADGLGERVVPVPAVEALYAGMAAGKDCLLWLRSPLTGVLGDGRAGTRDKPGKTVLERFDLVRRKLDVIADSVDGYAVSGDGTRLLVRDGTALRVLRTDRSGSSVPENGDGADEYEVDLARLGITVDPAAEWRQMFDEAARLMRDHFWIEDMGGVDWAAERERYRPLVDAVGSYDDLVDLLWEFQGELGSSHAYVRARWTGGEDGCPAFLGADLAPVDGAWAVTRVLPADTSAPAARSPLAAPGVDVRAGDVLLAVGGRPVDPLLGPAPLLVGTADTLVELTVRREDEVRRVVVRPLEHEDELRYQDWVAGRRAFVAERSGGRLGYLHVPDMMAPGWAQLHRDLSRETARDGLVFDLRSNGGGHTSQLVMEKLARRVTAWVHGRHREPRTYPADAPRGPVVAVTDELAGSDGDIGTATIKRRGIGPVVGVRTWGGVIGIDSRYRLVDGTGVTQPRYAYWFDDEGWEVENRGVEPDVEVVVTPQDWAAGRDPQLERAVDLALEALERTPPVRPPDTGTRPSRRRPALPPRP